MYIRTVGTTGDSSVILNSLGLLTENPTTLVVGGSGENYKLLEMDKRRIVV